MTRRARELATVLGGLTAVTLAFTYPLATQLASTLPGDLGDPALNAWILGWVSDRIGHGGAGLWTPPIFFPYRLTLAYSENLLGIAAFVAPIFWATRSPVVTYNLAYLATYVLAGFGAYVLVRELGGRRSAAWLAGLAFAFCPYRAAQSVHLQMLATGWMPLGLAALHRWSRTSSRWALAGFSAAYVLQVLSNGYTLYFFALPAGVVALGALRWRDDGFRRRLAELVAAGAAIVAALAPVLHLYLRVRDEQGLVRGVDEIRDFGADLGSFLHAAPGIVSARWLPGFAKAEGELFPGLVTVILAAVAWVTWSRDESAERRRARRVYTTIAALAAVLALGVAPTAWGHPFLPTAPYRWLLHVVPGLDGLRVPARLAVVLTLGLAVLAGLGGSWLVGRARPGARVPVVALFAAALVLEGHPGATVTQPLGLLERHRDDPINEWLAKAPPGAVLQLPFSDGTPRTVVTDLAYQWAIAKHGHPIVNGYSGYGSPLARFLARQGSPLAELERTDELLSFLRSIGVRYVVARNRPPYRESPGRPARALEAIRAAAEQVAREDRVPSAVIFTLREASPEASPAPLSSETLAGEDTTIAVSRGGDRVAALTDRNPDTRWLTGSPQTGTDWLRVRLRAATAVSGIRLVMQQRSLGDYPRELRVRGIDDAGGEVTLFEGGALAALGRSLVSTPSRPAIALGWDARRLRTIEVTSTGRAACCGWSVHEVEVLAPPP